MNNCIGLVGIGVWGVNYIRVLKELNALKAVCDSDVKKLEKLKSSLTEDILRYNSYDQMVANQDVTAIIIAAPTPMHFELAKKALLAGKHCHIEKPMCESVDEAIELADIAQSKGLIISVGHIMLYHPCIEFIKGMIDTKEIGDLHYITAARTNLGQIRTAENVMWSLAPHDISIAQYLIGTPPLAVSATGKTFVQREQDIYDVTSLTLNFNGDNFAHIVSSWLDPEKVRLIKVIGSQKMIVFDDMDPRYKITVHDKGVDWDSFAAFENGQMSSLKVRTGEIRIPVVKNSEPLKAECLEFIDCCKTGRIPRTNVNQGIENVKILEAAEKSIKLGGAKIII